MHVMWAGTGRRAPARARAGGAEQCCAAAGTGCAKHHAYSPEHPPERRQLPVLLDAVKGCRLLNARGCCQAAHHLLTQVVQAQQACRGGQRCVSVQVAEGLTSM